MPVRGCPDVSMYSDYREFLKDDFQFRKKSRGGFSYRRFSKLAGLSSLNFLHLVLTKQRHLSLSTAESVAKVLKLQGPRHLYFLALVGMETASTSAEHEGARKNLLRASKQLTTKQLPETQSAALSSWHHLLIREMVFLEGFEADPKKIVRQLNGLISVEQAQASLDLLCRTGLLVRTPEGGFLAGTVSLDTGDHVLQRELMDIHHQDTLRVWSENLPDLGGEQQERGLINIPISRGRLDELKVKLRTFQDEIMGWLQNEENPDTLVQLGVYLMIYGDTPHAKVTSGDK